MSSSSATPEKTKRGFGIVAIVKRKRSKKTTKESLSGSDQQINILPSTPEPDIQPEYTSATETIDFEEPRKTMATMQESQVAELSKQVTEAYEDLDQAEAKIEEQGKRIVALEGEVDELRKKSSALESKVNEFEKVSADLDDESFAAAQEFQHKKEVEDLKEQLEKRKTLEQDLLNANTELQEVKAQNEAMQFQKERSTTRDKMKTLSEEKSSKEEVTRLQKELKIVEHNLHQQKSLSEVQHKANLDSIQRIQQKNKALQNRCDEMEKERLQLKLENNRLAKKLEKSGSYTEKKRLQTEQEAAAIELKTIQRKNAKLEKRLSMSTQMLDLIEQGSTIMLNDMDSPTSSTSASGVTSPIPVTLSEARIISMEKELQQMETKLSAFEEEKSDLLTRAITAEKNVEGLTMKLKQVDSELFQEKEANNTLESQAESLRQQATTQLSPEGDGDTLQSKVLRLEKEIEQNSIKFRVKEKDLWATVEAQKQQITELEFEKIALEESLLIDESTDVEDDQEENLPATSEKVILLEEQLRLTNDQNLALEGEVDKLRNDAADMMKSLEFELADIAETSQDKIIKDLKQDLKQSGKQYEDTIREISRLQSIIDEQVSSYNNMYVSS